MRLAAGNGQQAVVGLDKSAKKMRRAAWRVGNVRPLKLPEYHPLSTFYAKLCRHLIPFSNYSFQLVISFTLSRGRIVALTLCD